MDSPNYFEFSVTRKPTAKTKLLQFLIIFLSCLPTVLGFIFFKAMGFVWFLFVLIPIISIWFFMRFTKQEIEYIISSGDITFDVIYDNIQRKKLITVKIKEMSNIAPYEEKYLKGINNSITKRYDFCSSLDSEDIYFFTYNDEKKGKTLVTFNIARKAAQIMKFYNAAIVMKNDYRV